MARVTVEDCIIKIPNRFELVMVASQRAREIGSGAALMVERDNDKNPVVSLREIADTDISLIALRESLIKNHQKVIEIEEDEDEIIDVMDGENEWAAVAGAAVESEVADAGMQEEELAEDEESDIAAEVSNADADHADEEGV
ncbi:MAG: DNA-directed RNA polymerase subunit omega [Alphaproteobacteria bacterium]|nr:DNA-directed RNA polymerase subunit omega [Alphaproteobacteria bacterium]